MQVVDLYIYSIQEVENCFTTHIQCRSSKLVHFCSSESLPSPVIIDPYLTVSPKCCISILIGFSKKCKFPLMDETKAVTISHLSGTVWQ